jgi:hypothetical protein
MEQIMDDLGKMSLPWEALETTIHEAAKKVADFVMAPPSVGRNAQMEKFVFYQNSSSCVCSYVYMYTYIYIYNIHYGVIFV